MNGVDDLGMGMAQNHRPPGANEIDVLPAVNVGEVRALRAFDEAGSTANSLKGAYW
jgi:hypothetical protein